MRVREIAEWLGATFEGNGEKDILGVASLASAGADEIAFAANRKALAAAEASAAGCLLVPGDMRELSGRTTIRVDDPRAAFARVVNRFHPPHRPPSGIHPTVEIGADALIGEDVSIGPFTSIGAAARIGDGCVIGAGCAIGRNAKLGAGCLLHARVTVYDNVEIGERAILHSGCVLGADGFGFVMTGDHYEKFPQVGRVVIGSDVEIGANSCVDRAALGITAIGDGTKLDNMVHVAHNCQIGRHVVVAAQTGFSGGVVVEDYCVIGGQVGVGDKARIESRAVIGSGAGILTSKVVRGGQTYWGTPARPLKEYLEVLAHLARLPELRNEIAEIRASLHRLEEQKGR